MSEEVFSSWQQCPLGNVVISCPASSASCADTDRVPHPIPVYTRSHCQTGFIVTPSDSHDRELILEGFCSLPDKRGSKDMPLLLLFAVC